MAALRRLLVPVLELSRQRHNRVKLRSHVALPDVTPKQLVSTLGYNTTYIGKWPPELLEDMCKDCIRGFAFPGEIIAHENEPVSTHGLIIVVRGMVGVMRAGGPAVTAALVAEVMSLDPSAREGKQHAVPTRSVRAPTVLGEMQCLTDGINSGGAVRALSITDYVTINIARIREAITKHLPPAQLNATFNKEVRLARKAALRQFFHQTPPLMLLSWVCHEMTPDEVNRLIAQLTPEVAVPGQDIVVQGAAASSMYFLRRGTACIVVGGNVIPGVVLGPGKSFGEMGLLFHERRMATVRATSLCDLWVLSERALHSVFSREMVEKKIIGKATEIRTRMISSVSRATLKPALLSYPPFAELPDAGVAELLAALQPRVFPSGRVLLSAGHVFEQMLVIHGGFASTVDSVAEKFTKGAALAKDCIVRHRQLTTVTAVGVVDTFALSAVDARRILKSYGLLQRALDCSEESIRLAAHHRGVELRDVLEPRPTTPVPSRSASAVSSRKESGVGSSPTPSPSSKPRRLMSARAREEVRRNPYAQPFVELRRPASAVHAANVKAEDACHRWRHDTYALRAESFQYPVEPVLCENRVAVQRTAHKLWFDQDPQNVFRGEQFAASLAYLPSVYHASVTVRSMRLRSFRAAAVPPRPGLHGMLASVRSFNNGGGGLDAHPMMPHDDILNVAERFVRLEAEALLSAPQIVFLGESSDSIIFKQPGHLASSTDPMITYTKRPQFQPINPHSYAAVLPISVQPLTREEQHRGKSYGLRGAPARARRLSSVVLDESVILTHVAEVAEAKQPQRDLAELAVEMAHVLTLEERQDIATLGDEVLNDIDFLDVAWKNAVKPQPIPLWPKRRDRRSPPQESMMNSVRRGQATLFTAHPPPPVSPTDAAGPDGDISPKTQSLARRASRSVSSTQLRLGSPSTTTELAAGGGSGTKKSLVSLTARPSTAAPGRRVAAAPGQLDLSLRSSKSNASTSVGPPCPPSKPVHLRVRYQVRPASARAASTTTTSTAASTTSH